MYELGHILLLLWGGQVRVVGSQGMEDSPAVAAQFLAILRAILPKLAVPLWKEADQGSVRFSPTRNLQSSLFFFSAPVGDPLTGDKVLGPIQPTHGQEPISAIFCHNQRCVTNHPERTVLLLAHDSGDRPLKLVHW